MKVQRVQTREFIQQLIKKIGSTNVLTEPQKTEYYRKGFRVGQGEALAVVLPQTLLQLWQVVQFCVRQNIIVIMQAANTGVTGGSTPAGDDYDREIVIVSVNSLKGVHLLKDGTQVLAFPGSSLTELEMALEPVQREPHSVIGSSCIGASVIGGVCNNSGGSLVRRGPAFTEMALFARVNQQGELELVNNLGIDLGSSPEQILTNLQQKNYQQPIDAANTKRTWADDYHKKLRDVDADTPARYNADQSYLYEAAGCSGKLVVFAVRLSTFTKAHKPQVFYIGSNQEKVLLELRRLLLTKLDELPIAAEYLHRNCFDVAQRYGKPTFLAIKYFGAQAMPKLFKIKGVIDAAIHTLSIIPNNLTDKLIDWLTRCLPNHLPKRMMQFRDLYEHHLMLKVEGNQVQQTKQLLDQLFSKQQGDYFICNNAEGEAAFRHRFAVGSCSISYCLIHHNNIKALVSLDVALKRNDQQWLLQLPKHLAEQVELDVCCGHFLCLVNHQDYVLKAGADTVAFKQQVLEYLDERGARYPAEHNVGHWYQAKPEHEQHFRRLDPTNSFNPGVGKTTKHKNWQ